MFPPRYPSNPAAQVALLHVLRRALKRFGIPGTRWTLAKIHDVVDWLGTTTPAGICQLLDRLLISYIRGREYVHSPDPDYLAKMAEIADYLDQPTRATGGLSRCIKMSSPIIASRRWRAPTTSAASPQALAQRSYRSNRETRIVATLDPRDGRVLYRQDDHIGVDELVRFYQSVRGPIPRRSGSRSFWTIGRCTFIRMS